MNLGITQSRLGFLKFSDGGEEPVRTKRLRTKPFGEWTRKDLREEEEALRRNVEMSKRVLELRKWLARACKPFWAEHPEYAIGQIIELFPEPDRIRAKKIIGGEVSIKWDDLPFEIENRQAWHSHIENAILPVWNSGKEFGPMDILREAGIDENAPYSAAAKKYADDLLHAVEEAQNVAIVTADQMGEYSSTAVN